MTGEVDCQITQASKAFGELCNSVFLASDLSLENKRLVYQSVVLGVLQYGVETWAPTQIILKKLENFHRRCVRCIMGMGKLCSGCSTLLLFSWLSVLVCEKL